MTDAQFRELRVRRSDLSRRHPKLTARVALLVVGDHERETKCRGRLGPAQCALRGVLTDGHWIAATDSIDWQPLAAPAMPPSVPAVAPQAESGPHPQQQALSNTFDL